ncbi:hypothetical protein BN2475_450060 [Paraburkholderia ribeironis]|uniref:Chemotaxis methyl-accepting receptor Tar-related ligand-binding domain-containing protein n=1 Tax=Paraburkholderia ribeironis TaxID=1247936 RepID=A0A1N7S8X8_9BURK|nr:Tar ligand binding domain-containing protein [Paraburkholderia ribeironis]SIT43802.1 hypothetical protein BN2475_450060 [Paraburkholderia ribeironis]
MNGFTLSMKQRLTAAYFSLGLLCIFVAILGIKGIDDANERAQRAYEGVTRPGQQVERSFIMTLGSAIQLMEVLALTDDAARRQRLQIVEELQKASNEQFGMFERSKKAAAFTPIAKELVVNRRRFVEALSKVESLLRAGKT